MIRPTHAAIDGDAIRSNIRLIRRIIPRDTRVMAIVKANCYGHYGHICIPAMLAEGIDFFGVATIEEASALRALGVECRIAVLPPPLEGQYGLYPGVGAEATISNIRMAEELHAAASAAGTRLRVHLHLDTGMGRNGVDPAGTLDLLERITSLPGLDLVGFASHLATSDEPGDLFAHRQIEIFDATLRRALDAGYTFEDIHLANSGGVFNFPGSHYNLVRPGLALYGHHPTASLQADSGLRAALRLRTAIGNITRMPAGSSISYSRRYSTSAETLIATLPIGYADGLMRALTNRLDVLIGGRRYPVVGTICMDEVMVDLGRTSDINVGDEAVLIGSSGEERIEGWEMAQRAGTIPYEICTNLSSRVPRVGMRNSRS
jgi:alanine racemase